jgi:hypothetical protein
VKCIRLLRCVLVLATAGIGPQRADAQCATGTLNAAQSIDCMRTNQHPNQIAVLEGSHAYMLAELTNIAEISNPATAIYWERATQKAKELGIATPDYEFGDFQKAIQHVSPSVQGGIRISSPGGKAASKKQPSTDHPYWQTVVFRVRRPALNGS